MKKQKAKIFGRFFAAICVIVAIFCGGYFFLDKVVVPRYFGVYGIRSVPDLVGVVASLYKTPKESEIVTNAYTQNDFSNAITKLQDSGYNIESDGTTTENNFDEIKGDQEVSLTDREFAAVCDTLIKNGILVDALPNFNYLNMLQMNILQLIITPQGENVDNRYQAANISFIVKIDTVDIREQIAIQMETPKFLLNMIIPDQLYFTSTYTLDLSKSQENRISNGTIAINGRTAEQSETLINLLIEFIFPEEEHMNFEKFTESFGDIILAGIDVFGSFEFAGNIGLNGQQNGIVVTPHI